MIRALLSVIIDLIMRAFFKRDANNDAIPDMKLYRGYGLYCGYNDVMHYTIKLNNKYGIYYGGLDYALTIMAAHGSLETVTKLLESGANVHHCGDAALGGGVFHCRLDIVERLLEFGANARNRSDVLEWCTLCGFADATKKLLENGADVHYNGDIALINCVEKNDWRMIDLLLAHGANIHCGKNRILLTLKEQFNEEFADVVFQYCKPSDHINFPSFYLEQKILQNYNQPKSAAKV